MYLFFEMTPFLIDNIHIQNYLMAPSLVLRMDIRWTSPSSPPRLWLRLALAAWPPCKSSAAASNIRTESSRRSCASDGGSGDRPELDVLRFVAIEVADVPPDWCWLLLLPPRLKSEWKTKLKQTVGVIMYNLKSLSLLCQQIRQNIFLKSFLYN